jgi:hypothetical protein
MADRNEGKKGFKNLTSQEELAFLTLDETSDPNQLYKISFIDGHWSRKAISEDEL